MNSFELKKISSTNLHILDNLLQLYAHETNKYYDYSIAMGEDGRYIVKTAKQHLNLGWGYFILVCGGCSGFILLNRSTKSQNGFFIAEFYILPAYRKAFFYKEVLIGVLFMLRGNIEFRVLKKNNRALYLFEYLSKRYLSDYSRTEERECGLDYFRFAFDTSEITILRHLPV